MITLEKNVPMPKSDGLPRQLYSFFDEMEVGDSFVFEGTAKELKAFRTALRTRNWRNKGERRFEWRWVGDDVMRVWRTA